MQKSDFATAWKWAKWPTFLGVFAGVSLTKDVVARLSSPPSIVQEFLLGAGLCGVFALFIGGSVFVISLVIIKVKNTLNK